MIKEENSAVLDKTPKKENGLTRKVKFEHQNKKFNKWNSSQDQKGQNQKFYKHSKFNKFNQKQGFKKKAEYAQDASDSKNEKLFLLKKKERKTVRRQKDNKCFGLSKKLKMLWEEQRQGKCKGDRKIQLTEEMLKLVKGRVKELAYAHDTVRVLESMVAGGNATQRAMIFAELKSEVMTLVKSKYGKHFLLKMLHYGIKQEKEFIMKSFHGKIIELIRHKEAAEVVETAFNECANAAQRAEFVQEFYGASYMIFKSEECRSLQQLIDKQPEHKPTVIKHMKEILLRVLEKSVVKHSIVHNVLLQFLLHCDEESRKEIIEALREALPEILHTKDGSRVAMHCVWHGTTKDRKSIVKHLKPFVKKIAMEEHGHMVLLALFDCVDDTKLIEKNVVMELNKCLVEVSGNVHGRKVLIYLLSPRDPHFFCPDVIRILKAADNNVHSKKDVAVRHAELKAMVEQPLLKMINSQFKVCYTDNAFCLFVFTVLSRTQGLEVFHLIAELASTEYSFTTKNGHIIESKGSHFLLKQLILRDKDSTGEGPSFSETFVNGLPEGVLSTWIECNRGCFLLISLFESGFPSVVERIRTEMKGLNKTLLKKSFKGAEILLQKLKEGEPPLKKLKGKPM